jgi:hypothetical protein
MPLIANPDQVFIDEIRLESQAMRDLDVEIDASLDLLV